MHRPFAAALCSLCACAAPVPGGGDDLQSLAPLDSIEDTWTGPADAADPGTSRDTTDGDAQDTMGEVPFTGDAPSPGDEGGAEPDVDPFAGIQSHFLLTSPGDGGGVVLMDATFEGYEPTVFGAQVYGQTLKIWGSQEQTRAEVLVRLDQVAVPGGVIPGPPGGAAWVVVLVEGTDAYVTQLATGEIVIESCPDTPGMMVSGQLNGLVLFTTSGVGYQTMAVGGSFEVVLGDVLGDIPCSP